MDSTSSIRPDSVLALSSANTVQPKNQVHNVGGKSGGDWSTARKATVVALAALLVLGATFAGALAGGLIAGPAGVVVGGVTGFALAMTTLAALGIFHELQKSKPQEAQVQEGAPSTSSSSSSSSSSSAAAAGPSFTQEQQEVLSAIKTVQSISSTYTIDTPIETQREAHEAAKEFMKKNLEKLGADVMFVSVPEVDIPDYKNVEIQKLPVDIFTKEFTRGVQGDIQKDGLRSDENIVLYGVASQFNCSEAVDRFTPPPGGALRAYERDNTQGPGAQKQFNPLQVEVINAAANIGFNGLVNVLDDRTKGNVKHGYFTPESENADLIIQQLKGSAGKLEYPCVGNIPHPNGTKEVHQILVAAPAFGVAYLEKNTVQDKDKKDEIQFLCALHNFRAQFQTCIMLAQENKKPVVFKPVGVGLGVFKNEPEVVAKAFYVAAKEYENALRDNNVEVRFQVYENADEKRRPTYDKDYARQAADHLQLTQYSA